MGLLTMRALPHTAAADYRRIQLAAATRQMIDAMCTSQNTLWPKGRKRELLVTDILLLQDKHREADSAEDVFLHKHDLHTQMRKLAPRIQRVLQGRLYGETLPEMAAELQITEGRVSQLIREGVKVLQQELAS